MRCGGCKWWVWYPKVRQHRCHNKNVIDSMKETMCGGKYYKPKEAQDSGQVDIPPVWGDS